MNTSGEHFQSGSQVKVAGGDVLCVVLLTTAMCEPPANAGVKHEDGDKEESARVHSFYAIAKLLHKF